MKGWANVKKASEYVDVSEKTMRNWLKEGLKHSQLPSGTIRIRYTDIDEFLNQYTVNEDMVNSVVNKVCAEFNM
ncbi:MAG: helix-turn-helix domain-containing protein [Deltaproteobacteria bacterium]|nr:helix-turn-helix domain-containing protein [Deltaproteobacteria bacterium]